MKCEKIDTNYRGKNFRDYIHVNDVNSVVRHFQEGTILIKKKGTKIRIDESFFFLF